MWATMRRALAIGRALLRLSWVRAKKSIAVTSADCSERQAPFCVEKHLFKQKVLVLSSDLEWPSSQRPTQFGSYLGELSQQLKGTKRA
jgi:hypothetical protein